MAKHRSWTKQGWVPQQHGAWAMLIAPTLLGCLARLRAHDLRCELLPLAMTWFLGYFCFAATSLLIKAAPRRRAQFRRPVITYGLATAIAGIVTLLVAGVTTAWWAVVFAPLVVGTLGLVWQRQERSLASGALTVAAASLFAVTCYRPHPSDVVSHWSSPDIVAIRWLAIVCFAYFLGTVFAVKTMIRERNSQAWFVASVGFHLACVVIAVIGMRIGRLSPAWIGFFVLTLLRAVVLPLLGPRRGRTVKPGVLGAVEVVFTLALIALALSVGPLP